MRLKIRKTALLAGISFLCVDQAQAQDEQTARQANTAPSEVTNGRGIRDIIVTARRRSESLLETPVAVTAYSAEDLEKSHVTQLTELQKSTPSLIYEATGGTNSEARVFIRGVGNNVGNANFSAGVGIYIDGAFFGRVQGAMLDSVDMARIEVLRGPQGTLFGKNTIGGAVNITTVRPTTDAFSGTLEAGYGRFNRVRARASFNVPVIEDKLAVRISGLIDHDDGYSVNDVNGQELDNVDRKVIAGSLRFTPTENITFDVNAFYSRDRTNGRAIGCNVTGESPLGQPFLDACIASNANGIRHTRSDIVQTYPTDMFAISGQLAWNLGSFGAVDDLTFKVIGAHQRIDTSNTKQEFDGTDIDGIFGNQQHYIQGQTSGEIQLLGEAFDNKLNFVMGLYADREYAIDGPLVQHAHIFPQFEAFGVPLSYVLAISPKSWSRAAYAQFTYDFNEIISVTGGIRYTKDRTGARSLKYNQFEADPNNVVIVQPFLTDGLFLTKNSNWTPMASLQLNAPEAWTNGFLDQGMIYFTYSKGYKAGGWNAGGNDISGGVTSFKPEKVDNYEVGVKFAMFDRHLVGSITAFRMDYKDIQFSVAQPTEDFGIVLATFNAGAAVVKGIEVELQALLLDNLRITFNGDFNDAKYTRFDDESVPGGSRVGEPFAIIPDYRISGSIENRFPLGGEMALTPRFQVTRTGKRLFWQDPSPVIRAVASSGPVTVADASVRLDVNEQLSFDVYGKNIFNKKYINDSQTLGFITFRYYAAPVTWGATARVKF